MGVVDNILSKVKPKNAKMLTPEEELQLIIEYQAAINADDEDALKRCRYDAWVCYGNYVAEIARAYTFSSRLYDSAADLFQEGLLGLYHAIEKFDVSTGHRLSTYADSWIKQYISRWITNKSENVRIPEYARDIMRGGKVNWDGRVNSQELKDHILSLRDAADEYGHQNIEISLDATVSRCDESSETTTHGDMLADDRWTEEELETIDKLEWEHLQQVFDRIPDFDIVMMRMRGVPLREIGDALGVTREAARLKEKHALETAISVVRSMDRGEISYRGWIEFHSLADHATSAL